MKEGQKKLKRRGEGVMSFQTLTIIIIILAAIPVFVIVSKLIIGGEDAAEKDICQLSVLTKATTPEALQSQIPLDCRTQKICLSYDDRSFVEKIPLVGKRKESCSQFAGIENYVTIDLPKDFDEAAEVINEVTANALYDCWNMMGEGKLDLFGTVSSWLGFGGDPMPTCVVCSRVALAQNVPVEIRNKVDVNKYMKDNLVPLSDITYLQYFAGDNRPSSYAPVDIQNFSNLIKDKGTIIDDSMIKPSDELAIVFMQVKTADSITDVVKNIGLVGGVGIAVAGAFILPALPAVALVASAGTIATGLGVGLLSGAVITGGAATIGGFNTYFGQLAAIGYCGKFASKNGDGKLGCSILRAVDYSDKSINAFCIDIQGKDLSR
jgi:hypothetical protein